MLGHDVIVNISRGVLRALALFDVLSYSVARNPVPQVRRLVRKCKEKALSQRAIAYQHGYGTYRDR